jgi:hypothetical protein
MGLQSYLQKWVECWFTSGITVQLVQLAEQPLHFSALSCRGAPCRTLVGPGLGGTGCGTTGPRFGLGPPAFHPRTRFASGTLRQHGRQVLLGTLRRDLWRDDTATGVGRPVGRVEKARHHLTHGWLLVAAFSVALVNVRSGMNLVRYFASSP